MNNNKKNKCQTLVDVLNKVYDNRVKIQKKLRKKKYNKRSISVLRKYLTLKEYLLLKYFYIKMLKSRKLASVKPTKKFVKKFLKFDCFNIFFREYHTKQKLYKKYKKLTDKSFFSYDKRINLDVIVIDIISNKNKDL